MQAPSIRAVTARVEGDEPQRARFFRSFAWGGAAICALLAVSWALQLGLWKGAGVMAAGALALGLLPGLAHRTGLRLGAHLMAGVMVGLVAFAASLRGDLPMGSLVYLVVVPPFLAYVAGARATLAWAAVAASVAGWAFWRVDTGRATYADALGTAEALARRDALETTSVVGVLALVTGVALSIERRHRAAEAERLRLVDEVSQRAADVRLGRLAASMTHELNNPLAWLTSTVAFLKQHHAEPGGPQQHGEVDEALEDLGQGVARLTTVVADLQALIHARDAGHGASVERTLRLARSLSGRDVRLQLSAAPALPAVVASEGLLAELLADLLAAGARADTQVSASVAEDRQTVRLSASPVAPVDLARAREVLSPWGATVRLEAQALHVDLARADA